MAPQPGRDQSYSVRGRRRSFQSADGRAANPIANEPFFAIEIRSRAGNHGYLFGDRRPLRRELFFWKNCAESLTMLEEKDAGIGAERGKIQYDHDEREKIHSHCQSDADMHP